MPTYVLSDLHLHDDDQPFLFSAAKERILCDVLAEARAEDADLVLAGDVFDLTGMNPPSRALADFFRVLPKSAAATLDLARLGEARPVEDRIAALHARYGDLFAALKPFAADTAKLSIIPGNHDFEITSGAGRQALARALGADDVRLLDVVRDGSGEALIAAHGQQYDASNDTAHGWKNRGSTITQVLYRAVQPALLALSVRSDVAYAIPAVRPEENIVDGLRVHIPGLAQEMLVAFARLLYENGYFAGIDRFEVWLSTTMGGAGLDFARARKSLADDGDLYLTTRGRADKLREHEGQLVILGHTHVFDGQLDYVNLGTWIDHVTGLTDAELAAKDVRLPVVRLADDGSAVAYDASHRAHWGRLSDCPALWSRPSPHA